MSRLVARSSLGCGEMASPEPGPYKTLETHGRPQRRRERTGRAASDSCLPCFSVPFVSSSSYGSWVPPRDGYCHCPRVAEDSPEEVGGGGRVHRKQLRPLRIEPGGLRGCLCCWGVGGSTQVQTSLSCAHTANCLLHLLGAPPPVMSKRHSWPFSPTPMPATRPRFLLVVPPSEGPQHPPRHPSQKAGRHPGPPPQPPYAQLSSFPNSHHYHVHDTLISHPMAAPPAPLCSYSPLCGSSRSHHLKRLICSRPFPV